MNSRRLRKNDRFTRDARARAGERLTVVFFDGSLTWSANASEPNVTGFRGLMAKGLAERYPAARFTFVDAAIGGTGSDLGVFRLVRDVLAKGPDLVFLDFSSAPTVRPSATSTGWLSGIDRKPLKTICFGQIQKNEN